RHRSTDHMDVGQDVFCKRRIPAVCSLGHRPISGDRMTATALRDEDVPAVRNTCPLVGRREFRYPRKALGLEWSNACCPESVGVDVAVDDPRLPDEFAKVLAASHQGEGKEDE